MSKSGFVNDALNPNETLAPDGTLWWRFDKIGGTKRIAAYFYFNVNVGDTFTMEQLRDALGDRGEANKDEQLNRRLRELREHEWVLVSYKDDKSVPMSAYRLEAKGKRRWLGEKVEREVISNKIRRQVFERDKDTCVVCGVAACEEYPDIPNSRTRITVGHRIPNQRLGEATLDNLQTECSRCNETVRNLLDDPETFDDLLPAIQDLPMDDLRTLYEWLVAGRRTPSRLDEAYARIRKLTESERVQMTAEVASIIGK